MWQKEKSPVLHMALNQGIQKFGNSSFSSLKVARGDEIEKSGDNVTMTNQICTHLISLGLAPNCKRMFIEKKKRKDDNFSSAVGRRRGGIELKIEAGIG